MPAKRRCRGAATTNRTVRAARNAKAMAPAPVRDLVDENEFRGRLDGGPGPHVAGAIREGAGVVDPARWK